MRGIGTRRLILVLALVAPSVHGLDPERLPTQYARRNWRAPDALPHDDVTAILQTRDGYLWVGTVEGLARFDGVRSVVFDKSNTAAFTNNWVKALVEDKSGRLWIGTFGGGLVCRENGRFVRYDASRGLPQDMVLSLVEDKRGRLWAGTDDGVFRLEGSAFIREPGLVVAATTRVRALREDPAGTLWIGADDGLYRWADGVLGHLTHADGLPDERIMALAADAGGLWVATERGGIARIAEGRISTITRKDGLAHDRIWSLAVDHDQNLWIGTDGGGLQRLRDGRLTTLSTRNGLESDFVWAIHEDAEANLWVGTNGGGLTRMKNGRVVPLTTREGLPSDFIWSIRRTRDGSLWIGTEDAGLVRIRDGTLTQLTTRDGLSHNQAKALFESRDGTLWIGGDGGLDRWKDGRVSASSPRVGGRVNAMTEASDGTLWIATDRAGLLSITPRSTAPAKPTPGMPSVEVTALLAASDGAIWAGTVNGLARLANGTSRIFAKEDGMPSSYVSGLIEDPEGVVWAATRGGLARIVNDQVTSVTQRQGLFDDAMMMALAGGDGSLWIGGNRGLHRVWRSEVEDVMDGRRVLLDSLVLGLEDGLRSVEINGASTAGWRDVDGRLFFATRGGVASVDPKRLGRSSRPPPVLIEEILTDDRVLETGAGRVRAGTRRLAFRFTAIGLSAPSRLRFAWRLDGFDTDWVDGGDRRRADYTNLPPGPYRFHVKARNEDGVWNEEGASASLEIEPRFYETNGFRALVVLLFAVLAPAFYLVRVRSLRRRQAELETLVAARTAELSTVNEALAQLSRQDPLTELWNRRRLEEALEEEWRRAVRQKTWLGFLLLDIDFFKQYNDRLGHPAGDACLKAVAATLADAHRRAGELVARYGGEEFAVLCVISTREEAEAAAENVRSRIEALALPHPGSSVSPVVTVSVGAAWAAASAEASPADLVAAADRALYQAKKDGRNRIEIGGS